jgi:hypothetical protein
MNETLTALAAECRLSDGANEALRLAFGLACAVRVRHLLEDPRALAGLDALRNYVAGGIDRAALREAAADLEDVANRHRGSNSIDGSAHAAVSATYAVANALAGRALEAAGYAAYATVYAYGGYAVSDRSAFAPEHAWQVAELRRLLSAATDGADWTP